MSLHDPRPAFLRGVEFDRSPGEEAARRKVREMKEAKRLADKYVAPDGGPPKPAADPEVKRLAAMPPLEYDRLRAEEAERLGVRVTTLDKEVARLRSEAEAEAGGAAVALPTPEPWPEPVDGADLLDDLADAIRRHLVVPTGAAEAVALWVLHAHLHSTASISAILAVTSPTPECGKTTLLTILGALVPRPLPASNITAAALFRAVEKWQPCLLVDEADTFLRNSDELRGVLNSGHNRAAAFVIRTTGDDHEPRRFATWAPKAIALIGKLPATLASRSIHVELRRIAPGEDVVPVRADRLHHLEPLARKAVRWGLDNEVTVGAAEPEMPKALAGRRADNWRHLIAIADAAGGDWPEKARRAAEALSGADSGETAAIMLLADIRAIFAEQETDRLTSRDIADRLGAMLDRPWPEWGRGEKPITERQIAKLLEPFKVKPRVIRTATGTPRGYLLEQLKDAFARYLPDESATPQQPSNFNSLAADQSATQSGDVADGVGPEAAENQQCCGVADGEPSAAGGALCEHCDQPGDLLEVHAGGSPVMLHRECEAAWIEVTTSGGGDRDWPEHGYTMSGRELEALCEASGHSLKDFALRIGLPGQKVRSLRASKQVELGDDPFAVAAVDQMRGEASQ